MWGWPGRSAPPTSPGRTPASTPTTLPMRSRSGAHRRPCSDVRT
nr:MAG TPA: hypothetical protein [Caudoviricetes sp.]